MVVRGIDIGVLFEDILVCMPQADRLNVMTDMLATLYTYLQPQNFQEIVEVFGAIGAKHA